MDKRADISGSELVTQVFGYWPSFHDAEVIRMSFETTTPYAAGPDLRADIYTFEITNEVGSNGAFILQHHTLVSFRFSGIENLRMDGFGNQNAIMGLSIADVRSRQLETINFEVTFEGSFGVSAEFMCRDVSVESVRAWKPERGGEA